MNKKKLSTHEVKKITDNLDSLLAILPSHLQTTYQKIEKEQDGSQILEMVFDLGRIPKVRLTEGDIYLGKKECTRKDLEEITSQLGNFDGENRVGIPRTLHRISAIRNKQGDVIGLTCRVGRAVYGVMDIVNDIITTGKSILFLGAPGVGKTTMLREAARILANNFQKRVVIIDTANEIGGDGDIPHQGIGEARRMQVPFPSLQHKVMIEAVENHMPEVIIIDEISSKEESQAARSIAERGVQLIGTAHGRNLENLILNPALSDLAGGIQSVVLSDEEAFRRGTTKSVLERMRPATFNTVLEIINWDTLKVHFDTAEAVDKILAGKSPMVEIRTRDGKGKINKQLSEDEKRLALKSHSNGSFSFEKQDLKRAVSLSPKNTISPHTPIPCIKIFLYGITPQKARDAAADLPVKIQILRSTNQVEVMLIKKNLYSKRPKKMRQLETEGIPLYILRENKQDEVKEVLANLIGLPQVI